MQYVKIPVKIYSTREVAKYHKSLNQEGGESRDEALERAGYYDSQENLEPLDGEVVFMRIPLDELIGCTYQPVAASEADLKEGIIENTIIFPRESEPIECEWDINTLEKNLIEWEIVSPKIKNQKESLTK